MSDWQFRITTRLPVSVNDLYEGFGKKRHLVAEAQAFKSEVQLRLNTMNYAMAPVAKGSA